MLEMLFDDASESSPRILPWAVGYFKLIYLFKVFGADPLSSFLEDVMIKLFNYCCC